MPWPLPTGRRLGVLVLALLLPGGTAAETVLRWEDVLAALPSQPELAAARAERDAAAADRRALALPNPELELAGGRAEPLDADVTRDTWELGVSLPLRPWGPWRHARAAAAASVTAADAALDLARRDLRRQLARDFWQVAHDGRRLALLDELRAHAEGLVQLARLRVELGEARPAELLRLELEREELLSALAAADVEARLARAALGRRLALRDPADLRVDADWDTLPPLPAADPAASHPPLAGARARSAAADARLAAARADRWPGLRLGALRGREADADVQALQLSLELPLFDRRGAGVDRARAETSRAREEQRRLERELADALDDALAHARLARDHVTRLEAEVLPRARRALDALETEYRVGEADLVALLDARRAHARSALALLAARLDYRFALADLDALNAGDDDHAPDLAP